MCGVLGCARLSLRDSEVVVGCGVVCLCGVSESVRLSSGGSGGVWPSSGLWISKCAASKSDRDDNAESKFPRVYV